MSELITCYLIAPGVAREGKSARLRLFIDELRENLVRQFPGVGFEGIEEDDLILPVVTAVYDKMFGEDGWDEAEHYGCDKCDCVHVRPMLKGEELTYAL